MLALVTPMGAPTDVLVACLKTHLGRYGYAPRIIRLSSLLSELGGGVSELYDERAEKLIRLGDICCDKVGRNDAVARLGIRELRRLRDLDHSVSHIDLTGANRAWIFRSLKRPEEIALLRHTYGESLYVIAINASYEARVKQVVKEIRLTRPSATEEEATTLATRIIELDEREAEVSPEGQNVRQAFPLSDVILPGHGSDALQAATKRFIEALFGENLVPTAAEYAMHVAEGAAALTSALGRKVGASITTVHGELVAVGANEVPKAGGGLRGAEDIGGRDEDLGADYSALSLRYLVAKTVGLLKDKEWLSAQHQSQDKEALAKEAIDLFKENQSPLMDIIEFMRPVHAEMAALLDAARRGLSTADTTLYTTAYPCHLCAKEIVAAGVKSVIYIEQYPKSRAESMYGEEIGVSSRELSTEQRVTFRPFEGITPIAYRRLFRTLSPSRKDQSGRVIASAPEEARPKVGNVAAQVMSRDALEDEVIDLVLDPPDLTVENSE